jgi:serine/threonine-protein kinase
VHRDLKPANVLVTNGVAKIADFGLAAFGGPTGQDTSMSIAGAYAPTGRAVGPLTHDGAIFGTPSYMAPELSGGVRDVQPPSDVFAFGLIAHEMIFGISAFAEPPLVAKLSGRAITPTPVKGIEPILARCLDLDPTKRPSASELVEAFE